ncbi:MAG: hypothetical protein K2Y18_06115 [Alphaproteobacteria bacterium]|jgi:hypothetical protein|nr:hypothetical protein [Alphaproteobacteria bacterium]
MKLLTLKMYICTLIVVPSALGMENELAGIFERATHSGGLAAKAFQEEKKFREETIAQINNLRKRLSTIQNSQKGEDPEAWQAKILSQINRDEATTALFNTALKKPGVKASFPVNTHKTLEILTGVKPLITESFFEILEGNNPKGYSYDQQTVTQLGGDNTITIWGNSRGTYLKTALLYMLATHEEGPSKGFGSMGLKWFDGSALAHVAALPDLELDMSSYSFACPYEPGAKLGLVIPHSGYSFGGHLGEPRYGQGKRFGPQDCSSGVAFLTGSPAYTTADQLCAYRKLSGLVGLIPAGWETGADATYLLKNMEVVTVKDPQNDIQPGQIYWHRRFANTDPEMKVTVGSGGHTAITLGYLRDGSVVTIGYNRDMPKLEGFGIQNFLWAAEPLKKKGLFHVKGL